MRRSQRQARTLAGARVLADQARVPPRGGGGGGPRRAVADAERARWQVLARAWTESAESGDPPESVFSHFAPKSGDWRLALVGHMVGNVTGNRERGKR